MSTLFQGTISVKAILEEGRRPVEAIYMDEKKRSRDFGYIYAVAANKQVPVIKTSRQKLDEMAGSRGHGGVLAQAKERTFETFEQADAGFNCLLDGVEDPYNLGSCLRTLYAMGCIQVILPARNRQLPEDVILKASAGAYEKLKIVWLNAEEDLIDSLQTCGIPLICAARSEAISLDEFTFPETFVLAVGGALRGLSARILAASSQNVYIPYLRPYRNALDTPSSVAIFAYAYEKGKNCL